MDPQPYGSLDGYDTQEVFILTYLLADKFLGKLSAQVGRLRRSNNTTPPVFTDAEMIATLVTKELKAPGDSLRAWFFKLSSDFLSYWPDLPSWSRWIRRKNQLANLVE